MRVVWIACFVVIATLRAPVAATADFTTRPLPRPFTTMAFGPDGNLWLGDSVMPGHLARISLTDGLYTEWVLDGCSVRHIVAGPDGNVWLACDGLAAGLGFPESPARLQRVTPTGQRTAFLASGGRPDRIGGMAAGDDGKLWYSITPEFHGLPAVLRMTPGGAVDGTFTDPALHWPGAVVAGSDGAVWVAGFRRIHRVSTDGAMTHVGEHDSGPPSGPNDFNNDPHRLLAGPDGAIYASLWDPGYLQPFFARVTTDLKIALQVPWHVVNPVGFIDGMANAPGGTLWISSGGRIFRVNVAGQILGSHCPSVSPGELIAEPDGDVWFLSTRYRDNFVDRDSVLVRLTADTPAGSGCATSSAGGTTRPAQPPAGLPPAQPGQALAETLGLAFAGTPRQQNARMVLRRGLRTRVRLDRGARVTYTIRSGNGRRRLARRSVAYSRAGRYRRQIALSPLGRRILGSRRTRTQRVGLEVRAVTAQGLSRRISLTVRLVP